MSSILTTGKDAYDCDGEFDRRTRAAVAGGRPSSTASIRRRYGDGFHHGDMENTENDGM